MTLTSPYTIGVFVVFIAFVLCIPYGTCAWASMDITAYEYQQKFGQSLNLGDCPHREVAVKTDNDSVHVKQERCTLHKRGTVTHMPRELNDSRNVLISSPNGIVAYLGLCGGEVASFLGILHSGDCVAVEIASRLSFDKKTVIRAFVGYYRKSLDILDGTNQLIREGMETYYRNNFYLKNRSYGTLEIIFVQFRYRNSRQASAARKIEVLSDPTMSTYMEKISQEVGKPKAVTIISLSTATQEKYKIKKEKEWARALRYVQILQLGIQKTRAKINDGEIKPHLKYQLFPFVMEEGRTSLLRLSNPITWEKTSMLEVQLRQSISMAKKSSQKCRKNKTRPCRRVRGLRRKLIASQAEIHKVRSNWVNLAPGEKLKFVTEFTALVKAYTSVTKSLSREVRIMRRKEKLAKLSRKRNRYNEIPMVRTSRTRSPFSSRHRIRHSNRKRSRRFRARRFRNSVKV